MDVWIKLHSKITEWEWYQDTNTKSLFIHCLLKANWKDGRFRGYEVPRGSFVTSYQKLAKDLGMSIQQVRTSLEHLKLTHEVTHTSTSKFSIISIENYDRYQLTNTQVNNQVTSNQQQYKNIDINNNNYINNIEQNFGRTLAPLEVEMALDWLNEVDDLRKIDYAIKETIINGVRNLRYTNAIIQNIKDTNYEDLINHKKEDESDTKVFDYDWINETN